MKEERWYFKVLWGCGNNCGFKAFDESFPKKPGRWGWYYCPWCDQQGRNLVSILPCGREEEKVLAVWDEVRVR